MILSINLDCEKERIVFMIICEMKIISKKRLLPNL